jgi:hypothetical protein
MKSSRTPASSQPASAPLATVAGSALDNTVNTNYLAYVSASAAAAGLRTQQADDELNTGEEDFVDDEEDLSEGNEGESDGDEDVFKKKNTPQLSDIEVISNEVVYDSANNPTAKIVFKVKNSSGELLKAVNVKVEKK